MKKETDESDYFQTLLVSDRDEEPLDEVKLSIKLAELNNYKKIALLETINMYLIDKSKLCTITCLQRLTQIISGDIEFPFVPIFL